MLHRVAGGKDRIVFQQCEPARPGFHLGRLDGDPLHGVLALRHEPGFKELVALGGGQLLRQGHLQHCDLRLEFRPAFRLRRGRQLQFRFVGVVHEREEAEVLRVRDRVELVRVALGTAHREPEPDGAGHVRAIDHGVVAELERVDAAFFVQHRVAVESGGDDLLAGGVRNHVSGELLDAEAIERHVVVEGFDDPIAVGPDGATAVLFVAVGVGVAGEVQPAAGPAFPIVRRREQVIDDLFKSLGRFVLDEGFDLLRGRWVADEVEVDAPNQRELVRGR